MQFLVLLLTLLGYAVTIRGSLKVLVPHPGGIGGIFMGPNSETIVKGPDGSIITNEHEGGAVTTGLQPIISAKKEVIIEAVTPVKEIILPLGTAIAAPVPVAAPLLVSAVPSIPIVTPLAKEVAHVNPLNDTLIVEKEAYLIERQFVDAPVVEPKECSDLVGPSGKISTKGSSSVVSGPASTTISEPGQAVVRTLATLASIKPVIEIIQDIRLPSAPLPYKPLLPITGDPSVLSSSGIQKLPLFVSPVSSIQGVDTKLRPIATISPSTPFPIKTKELEQNIQILSQVISSTPSSLGTVLPTDVVQKTAFSNSAPQEWAQTANVKPQQISGSSTWGYQQNVEYQAPGSIKSFKAWLQPPYTNNIIEQPTTIPETIASPTSTAPYSKLKFQQATAKNGQFIINPSSIPSRNIVPPETGLPSPLPKGTIDLGATVTVTTVPVSAAPGLKSSSTFSGNQRLNHQVEQQYFIPSEQPRTLANNIQTGNVPNGNKPFTQPNNPDWRGFALRDPRPIPQRGIIDSQLNQQGVDSTQINFARVSLSSVIGTPQDFKVYEDTGFELADRYGKRQAIQ